MSAARISMVIRRAQAREAQELSELAMRSKSHWPYPQDYLEKCVSALKVDAAYIEQWPVFVAEVAERTVGFFALKIINEEPRLDHLWILPEFIGKSIGRRLFARAIEEARRLGWTEFWLAADPYAIGFYEKLGAVQLGTVQSRIKPDLFLPHMKVSLGFMNLRRLNRADSELLFSLRLRALESEPTAFGSSVEDERAKGVSFFENTLSLNGPDNVIFGAFVGDTLVGMTGIHRPQRLKTKHKAGIWGMYVDGGYRGKGIGSALLDMAVRHAKEEMKVDSVSLSVESSNRAARALYLSRSFKTWGLEPKSMMIGSKYYDEEHMWLQF